MGLLTSVGGGITNVVLDWLFMGPMNMGVAGAAIATCLGYCVPSIVGLVYFTKNRPEVCTLCPSNLTAHTGRRVRQRLI